MAIISKIKFGSKTVNDINVDYVQSGNEKSSSYKLGGAKRNGHPLRLIVEVIQSTLKFISGGSIQSQAGTDKKSLQVYGGTVQGTTLKL